MRLLPCRSISRSLTRTSQHFDAVQSGQGRYISLVAKWKYLNSPDPVNCSCLFRPNCPRSSKAATQQDVHVINQTTSPGSNEIPPEQSPSTRYDTIGAIFFCSLPVGPLARSSRADHDCGFAVRPEVRVEPAITFTAQLALTRAVRSLCRSSSSTHATYLP